MNNPVSHQQQPSSGKEEVNLPVSPSNERPEKTERGEVAQKRQANLTVGMRFSKWELQSKISGRYWICRCDCGSVRRVAVWTLIKGMSVSCGCKRSENKEKARARAPEYRIWKGIRKRVLNKKTKAYPRYGGRGVTFCDRWGDYLKFIEDVGKRPTPKHSIDRIDNDGHYSCGKCIQCIKMGWTMNCRWATRIEQQRNKSDTRWVEYNGKKATIKEWSDEIGVPYEALYFRIVTKSWPLERALSEPSRKTIKSSSCQGTDELSSRQDQVA